MPETDSPDRVVPPVLAVVSTYNPGTALVDSVERLLDECTWVVVSDDGSSRSSDTLFERCELLGATVLRPGSNSGIAAALNRGIEQGLSAHPGTQLILTMDQDSTLDPGYADAVRRAQASARAAGVPVGMLTPDRIAGLPRRSRGSRRGIALSGEPIQSGLVIPVEAWTALGPLREDLFIDGVDSEYFLRAAEAGMHAVVATGAGISHQLGTMTTAVLFGRPLTLGRRAIRVRTAASWRYYFIFRNRIHLVRDHGARHPWWAVKGVLADLRHLAIVTLLAPGRRARITMACRGLREGAAGVVGPGPRRQAH